MLWVIFIIILLIVIMSRKKYISIEQYILDTHMGKAEEIESTDSKKKYILDKTQGTFFIYEQISKSQIKRLQTSIKNIISIDLVEDDISVQTVDRTSQLGNMMVGGLLLGGVGAIVGGLSSKKEITKKCNSLKLTFIFDNIDYPRDEITLLKYNKKGYKRTSDEYKNAIEKANTLLSIFTIFMKKDNNTAIDTTYDIIILEKR